jgi:hypothetical protein
MPEAHAPFPRVNLKDSRMAAQPPPNRLRWRSEVAIRHNLSNYKLDLLLKTLQRTASAHCFA